MVKGYETIRGDNNENENLEKKVYVSKLVSNGRYESAGIR